MGLWATMSRKKRDSGPGMPASSAGLIRFFQDESYGVKLKPEYVVAMTITLIVSVLLGRTMF
jgi:preprotein translocase subunit Sec61beta